MKHPVSFFLFLLPAILSAQIGPYYLIKKVSTNDVVHAFYATEQNGSSVLLAGLGCFSGSGSILTYSLPLPALPNTTSTLPVCDFFYDSASNIHLMIGKKGLQFGNASNPTGFPNTVTEITAGSTTYQINSRVIVVNGDYVFMEAGSYGLMCLKYHPMAATFGDFKDLIQYDGIINSMEPVNDQTLVMVDGYNAYYINHTNPAALTKQQVLISGDPYAVAVYNNYTFVSSNSTSGSTAWLYVLNNTTKTVAAQIDISSYGTKVGEMTVIKPAATDALLYVTCNKGFMVFNIADPANPVFVTKTNVNGYSTQWEIMVTEDGKFVYTSIGEGIAVFSTDQTLDVSEKDPVKDILRLWPNPADQGVHVELESPNESSAFQQIKIFDIYNQEIYVGNQLEDIPTGNFQPGIYLLQVKGKGFTRNKIFTVVH